MCVEEREDKRVAARGTGREISPGVCERGDKGGLRVRMAL